MRFSAGLFIALLLLCGGWADARVLRDGMRTAGGEAVEKPLVLKDQYKLFFLIGNVVSPGDLDGVRFKLLRKHFDILTAEDAMKPLYLQGEKGIFTFETADRLVNTTRAAGMRMHGHTLAWHRQSPEWMNSEGIDREEAIDNLVYHIQTVVDHFKGRVVSWDVINEAFADNPQNPDDWKSCLRETPWYKAIGPEYIEIAFRAAREADPNAILYYNDSSLENGNKALAVYNMIRELNEQNPDVTGGPLIDAVGMTGHYQLDTDVDAVANSLRRFISLGLEISITALDVQAGSDQVLDKDQAVRQALVYALLFDLFRENSYYLGRVTIWGLDDADSWQPEFNPTLFDKDLKPKPAYYGVLNPAAFLAENEDLLFSLQEDFLWENDGE